MGLLIHISASVIGLSVLLSKSIIAFEIIKWMGAAYLIYLGIRSILAKAKVPDQKFHNKGVSQKRLLLQGFLTNVFNPKVALFFLSFLPQFADMNSPYFSIQLLTLGGWFIFSGTVVSLAIAFVFSYMRNWLNNISAFWKIQPKITGLVFIALGLKVAFSRSH
jgi:threonine/homoserine/homoserine lactone efflux protein